MIEVRRTDSNGGWIQFDFLRLDAEPGVGGLGTTVEGGALLNVNLGGLPNPARKPDLQRADAGGRSTLRVTTAGGNITTLSGELVAESTGANIVQWNSLGGGTVRYTGDIGGDLINSLLFFRSNSTHEILGSVNLAGGGDFAITDGAKVIIGQAGEPTAGTTPTSPTVTLTTNLDNLLPSATNLTLVGSERLAYPRATWT